MELSLPEIRASRTVDPPARKAAAIPVATTDFPSPGSAEVTINVATAILSFRALEKGRERWNYIKAPAKGRVGSWERSDRTPPDNDGHIATVMSYTSRSQMGSHAPD